MFWKHFKRLLLVAHAQTSIHTHTNLLLKLPFYRFVASYSSLWTHNIGDLLIIPIWIWYQTLFGIFSGIFVTTVCSNIKQCFLCYTAQRAHAHELDKNVNENIITRYVCMYIDLKDGNQLINVHQICVAN